MAAKIEPTRKAESVREELVFNQDFKEKLLFKLHELRKDNFLCDVTLRIEGKDFAAHRVFSQLQAHTSDLSLPVGLEKI